MIFEKRAQSATDSLDKAMALSFTEGYDSDDASTSARSQSRERRTKPPRDMGHARELVEAAEKRKRHLKSLGQQVLRRAMDAENRLQVRI
jgi:hypothetical protein